MFNKLALNKTLSQILPLAIILFGLVGYSYMDAAWTAPTGTPPNNNIEAPINIGTVTQVKNGNIALNTLAALTDVRSDQYCDSLGNNCFVPSTVQTLAASNPTVSCVTRATGQCLAGETVTGGGCTDSCVGLSSGNCSAKSVISSGPTASNGWSCVVNNIAIVSAVCCKIQ